MELSADLTHAQRHIWATLDGDREVRAMKQDRTAALASLLCVLPLLLACGSKAPPQQSNLTVGMVKATIVKGETTQAELLEVFGAPNIITKNRVDDEVWHYSRMAVESTSSVGNVLAIVFNSSKASSTTTTRSFDLIITFDENDVVKDYSVIAAQF